MSIQVIRRLIIYFGSTYYGLAVLHGELKHNHLLIPCQGTDYSEKKLFLQITHFPLPSTPHSTESNNLCIGHCMSVSLNQNNVHLSTQQSGSSSQYFPPHLLCSINELLKRV